MCSKSLTLVCESILPSALPFEYYEVKKKKSKKNYKFFPRGVEGEFWLILLLDIKPQKWFIINVFFKWLIKSKIKNSGSLLFSTVFLHTIYEACRYTVEHISKQEAFLESPVYANLLHIPIRGHDECLFLSQLLVLTLSFFSCYCHLFCSPFCSYRRAGGRKKRHSHRHEPVELKWPCWADRNNWEAGRESR